MQANSGSKTSKNRRLQTVGSQKLSSHEQIKNSIIQGDLKAYKILKNKYPNVDIKKEFTVGQKDYPLIFAVKSNSIEMVKHFIEIENTNIYITDRSDSNLLHIALTANSPQKELILYLIEKGIEKHTKNSLSSTPYDNFLNSSLSNDTDLKNAFKESIDGTSSETSIDSQLDTYESDPLAGSTLRKRRSSSSESNKSQNSEITHPSDSFTIDVIDVSALVEECKKLLKEYLHLDKDIEDTIEIKESLINKLYALEKEDYETISTHIRKIFFDPSTSNTLKRSIIIIDNKLNRIPPLLSKKRHIWEKAKDLAPFARSTALDSSAAIIVAIEVLGSISSALLLLMALYAFNKTYNS